MREDLHHFSPARFYRVNIIFLIPILVIGFMVFLILTCTVTSVKVNGNNIISDSEIEGYVMTGKYKNNGAWDVIKNAVRPPEIPFIKSTSVRLKHFHTLTVTVKEKELTGYLRDKKNNYVYVDKNGTVTEIDTRLLGNAIPVEGLTTKKDITKGKMYPAPENRVSALSIIFKSMKNMGLDIDEITFGSSGQITLTSGTITASLGTADRLKDKLLRLSYILPKVQDETGVLHFEDYTEDNTDIVFQKTKSK